MRFFVPPKFTGQEAEEVYIAVLKHLSSFGIQAINTEKIFSLSFKVGNELYSERVGDKSNSNNEPVCVILEAVEAYYICTPNFGIVRNLPIRLEKKSIILNSIEYFNTNIESYKYGDRNYILDKYNNHKVEHPLPQPNSLYKYYSNTEFNRHAVVNTYLFCSHPYHLNDPMDFSSLLWDFSKMTEERYISFFEHYNLPMIISFTDDKANNFNFVKSKFWEIRTEKSGIISLSGSDLNTLMWAHYSTENGFLFEFNTQKLIREVLTINKEVSNYVFMPIQYVKTIETIDFFSEEFHSADIPYLYALNIKKNDWEYENEWRLVCYSKNFGIPFKFKIPETGKTGEIPREIFYDKDTVSSIVLGQHFLCGKNVDYFNGKDIYVIENTKENPTNFEFVDFLYMNYNDRLFMCDGFDPNESFKRKKVKISLEKIDDKAFKVIRE